MPSWDTLDIEQLEQSTAETIQLADIPIRVPSSHCGQRADE